MIVVMELVVILIIQIMQMKHITGCWDWIMMVTISMALMARNSDLFTQVILFPERVGLMNW